jgi:large subunit ribosomal protein L33
MAKKTHVKVRLVPESKPDSPFFYYVKKPAGGEKAKVKLSAKKIQSCYKKTRKHLWKKKLPPHSK